MVLELLSRGETTDNDFDVPQTIKDILTVDGQDSHSVEERSSMFESP